MPTSYKSYQPSCPWKDERACFDPHMWVFCKLKYIFFCWWIYVQIKSFFTKIFGTGTTMILTIWITRFDYSQNFMSLLEEKFFFVSSFFSASQREVVNSFVISSFLISPHIQFAYGTKNSVSFSPLWLSSSCLPSCHSKESICHHHSPSLLFAFSRLSTFFLCTHFFLSIFLLILFASLEAANVMRYHCRYWM